MSSEDLEQHMTSEHTGEVATTTSEYVVTVEEPTEELQEDPQQQQTVAIVTDEQGHTVTRKST